ncbi:MAG: radical SAM protein [Burkholderiales bacterium]|nr:radical SAM protein [Burkholderiales bacterium]
MGCIGVRPAELVVLQGNSLCNLNCRYCDLSVASRRAKNVMDLAVVRRLFEDIFRGGYAAPTLTVVWHSGEPLTLPPAYYDEAITLIQALRDAHAPQIEVQFKIQTNGVLINTAWCEFFARHAAHLQVGVSCDGTAEMHDAYRVNWNGRATHAATVRGMDLLEAHGLPYKIIAVVTNATLTRPRAFFDFFHARRERLNGFHFNILAAATAEDSKLAYSRDDRAAYYAFYRTLLGLCREQPGFPIENFTLGFARIMAPVDPDRENYPGGESAPIKAITADAQGNLTTFYAGLTSDVLGDLYGDGSGFSIGNIVETPLEDMLASEKLKRIVADFEASAEACRTQCPYFHVCPGGYEITKRQTHGTFAATETSECVIHVKALADALLDDIDDHLAVDSDANLAAV